MRSIFHQFQPECGIFCLTQGSRFLYFFLGMLTLFKLLHLGNTECPFFRWSCTVNEHLLLAIRYISLQRISKMPHVIRSLSSCFVCRQFNYGKYPERSCEKHVIKQPYRSPLICILKRDQHVSLLVIDHRIGLSVEKAGIETAR